MFTLHVFTLLYHRWLKRRGSVRMQSAESHCNTHATGLHQPTQLPSCKAMIYKKTRMTESALRARLDRESYVSSTRRNSRHTSPQVRPAVKRSTWSIALDAPSARAHAGVQAHVNRLHPTDPRDRTCNANIAAARRDETFEASLHVCKGLELVIHAAC